MSLFLCIFVLHPFPLYSKQCQKADATEIQGLRKTENKMNHQHVEYENSPWAKLGLHPLSHQDISTQMILRSKSQDFKFMLDPSQKPTLQEDKGSVIMQIVLDMKKKEKEQKISKDRLYNATWLLK